MPPPRPPPAAPSTPALSRSSRTASGASFAPRDPDSAGGKTTPDIDANVVCRQLGFPQGTVFDTSAAGSRGSDNIYDYVSDYSFLTNSEAQAPAALLDDLLVFANHWHRGAARGLQFFPERDAPSPLSDCSSAPAPGPEADLGLGGPCTRFQAERLGVVCQRFALEGAQDRVCPHAYEMRVGVPSVARLASASLAVTRSRSQQPLRALMLRSRRAGSAHPSSGSCSHAS